MAAAAPADDADPAAAEAHLLLRELGVDGTVDVPREADIARWAESGVMLLTGDADAPPRVPEAPVASRLLGAAAALERVGGPRVDGPALLGERAALRGMTRRGGVSAGGAARLLPAADGWVAVTLARPDDVELVPAWLHLTDADWAAIAVAVAGRTGAELAAAGQELGLAVAVVPPASANPDAQLLARDDPGPWRLIPSGGPRAAGRLRVLDLSALWAGPLCAHLLGVSGADVVTVDSVSRPDGARVGDAELFALLHRGHTFRPLDLRAAADRSALDDLIGAADIVVTSARPRALHQLGLSPLDAVRARPGLTWVAITAYGLTGPWSDRVGFGDDCAAAGGLVVDQARPLFVGDAAADPATGLYAAAAALSLARTGGGVVDIALREVARHLARPPHRAGAEQVAADGRDWRVKTADGWVPVAPPRARL